MSKRKMQIPSFFRFFLSASIVSCGVSVSLSQGFLGLALVASLFLKDLKLPIRSTFLVASIFWGYVFFNVFFHFALEGWDFKYLYIAFGQEPKDFFLFLACVTMLRLRKKDSYLVYQSLVSLLILLIVTGFVSIFSEFRLGWLITSLHREMTTWGRQHLLGSVAGIQLYLPIGLMNTHLTFGGLLLLTYPFLFFRCLFAWEKKESIRSQWIWWVLLCLATIVFFLNNARSAMGGTAFSLVIGYFIWKKKGYRLDMQLRIPTSILLVVLFSGMILWNQSEAFRTIVGPIFGLEKHTDSGRTFIWNSTYPLIADNPILGVGPGNFSKEIETSRKNLSIEYPELLFFYETTQRGHAHNDYIHLAAIFGIPLLLLFLVFLVFLYKEIINSDLPFPHLGWFLGIFGFGIAGLLQCYFQDDEVVLVFWYLVGYLIQSNRWNLKNEYTN